MKLRHLIYKPLKTLPGGIPYVYHKEENCQICELNLVLKNMFSMSAGKCSHG